MNLAIGIVYLTVDGPILKESFYKEIVPTNEELKMLSCGGVITLCVNGQLYISANTKDSLNTYLLGLRDSFHFIQNRIWTDGRIPSLIMHTVN